MNKASTYDESIFDLYVEEKLTMKEVADTLGISVGKVFNRLKVMGVHSRGHKDYLASEEVIENCRKLGLSGKGKKLSEKTKALIAEAHFKGGIGHKKKRCDGYISIYFPDHPRSTKEGYIMEHVLVMEAALGRHLSPDEVVHHKNFKRDDNRLSNLQLMTKHSHMSYHMKLRHKKRRMEE